MTERNTQHAFQLGSDVATKRRTLNPTEREQLRGLVCGLLRADHANREAIIHNSGAEDHLVKAAKEMLVAIERAFMALTFGSAGRPLDIAISIIGLIARPDMSVKRLMLARELLEFRED